MKKWLLVILSLAIASCSNSKEEQTKEKQTVFYQVENKTTVTPLYFSGTVLPLQVTNVITPVEGTIVEENFKYGQHVKKGQQLVTIESEKLQQDFQNSVSDYLKAVDDHSTKKRRHDGSKELRELGFVSENEYFADKTGMEESYFSLQQTRLRLKTTIKKLAIEEDIENINLRDPNVVDALLEKRQDKIFILSPTDGIALYPEKSGSEGNSDGIFKGMDVKQNDILLAVGDRHGLAIKVEVNEIDINQIKLNQKATITGSAFPGITLHGFVKHVDAQASKKNINLPTFPIRIEVSKITEQQRNTIHVGMSAKVRIDMEEDNILTVPIDAVYQTTGQTNVKRKDPTTGDIIKTPVVTGKTTQDTVIIKHGLNSGDIIVYNH